MTKSKAQTHNDQSWLIQPKACIVQELGDACSIVLSITLPPLSAARYCYTLNDIIIDCFDVVGQNNALPIQQLTITFSQNAYLSLHKLPNKLQSADNQGLNALPAPMFTQLLEIRTRQNSKKVRRVRSPWSLF